MIQRAQFTDLLTGLRLSRQCLGLFGFGLNQVSQGGVNPGREGRGRPRGGGTCARYARSAARAASSDASAAMTTAAACLTWRAKCRLVAFETSCWP